MTFLKRFGTSLVLGFLAAPVAGAASVALCDTPVSGINAALLQGGSQPVYVKTWGVPWVEDWDVVEKRGAKLPDRASSQNRRQIIMIRHGQYENERSNEDAIRRLTGLGHEQARRTGQHLRELFDAAAKMEAVKARRAEAEQDLRAEKKADADGSGDGAAVSPRVAELQALVKQRKIEERSAGGFLIAPAPRYVHVSDMTRAKETAQDVLEVFPADVRKRLVVDPQLRERFPCDPSPVHSCRDAVAADMQAVEDVFDRYFHRPFAGEENTVEVIVGHANVIRYLTLRALQLPPEAWLRTSLSHASITSVVINGHGRVKVNAFGSMGHLPPEMVTTHNLS